MSLVIVIGAPAGATGIHDRHEACEKVLERLEEHLQRFEEEVPTVGSGAGGAHNLRMRAMRHFLRGSENRCGRFLIDREYHASEYLRDRAPRHEWAWLNRYD